MKEYSKIEIDTARNLVRDGYHWIARMPSGKLGADIVEMVKGCDEWLGSVSSLIVASKWVPIFPDVTWHDDHSTCIDDIAYPPILDDTERRYLERVLRPLPEVRCIRKKENTITGQLVVEFANNLPLYFPTFETGTMYKGMIGGRNYTPDELKLNLEGKHEAD